MTVNYSQISITKNGTVQLRVTTSPSAVVTYGSYDSRIAKVDKNGKVTGVSAGTTSIYVKANGLTKVIPITVYAK